LHDGAGEPAGLQPELPGGLAAHQRDDAERTALQLDLRHHGVRHDPGDQPREAVPGGGGGRAVQLGRHRQLPGEARDLDPLEHLPAARVVGRLEGPLLDPPSHGVLTHPEEGGGITNPHLRHEDHHSGADAGSWGGSPQATSSTPPSATEATSAVESAARRKGRGPTCFSSEILTPVPSANIAAASRRVCRSDPASSAGSGSGTKERTSTMARKPTTNSCTSGGCFPSFAPCRRCCIDITAITGASISTRAKIG